VSVQFDLAQLRAVMLNPDDYGRRLTQMLCADSRIRDALVAARNHARGAAVPLRIRLRMEASDPFLTAVHWELLRDPVNDTFLCTSADIRFARMPMTRDETAIRIPTIGQVQVLVAVAAPDNLADYGLTPLHADDEIKRISSLLEGVQVRSLVHTTSATLSAALLEGPTVLYLVCHGAVINGEPTLYLADAAGKTAPMSASRLAQHIQNLDRRPLLIVLANCYSAASLQYSDADQSTLGLQLTRAGIGAVLAMHGRIAMTAIQRGMPLLFSELTRHGEIDRAVAVMRNMLAVHGERWWQPILYQRLKDGRIWKQEHRSR
jgi:hypothetical protein